MSLLSSIQSEHGDRQLEMLNIFAGFEQSNRYSISEE